MESVKGNSDRKQNVQLRVVDRRSPIGASTLKILEQKVSVFEKPEHAQIHANARDQPATSCMLTFGLCHLTTKPESIAVAKQEAARAVPGAIKNVAGCDDKIFPRLPRFNTPVKSDDDDEENDET